MQHRCVKDVSMTCTLLNQHDDHIVNVRNYSSKGMYFESDEAVSIGSYIVLRAMGAHEMAARSSSDRLLPFSMESTDPLACRGYRSHTIAKVVRCKKMVEAATGFGIGAEIMMLSD